MKILETTCYSHLLYLQTRGPDFKKAVKALTIVNGPNYSHEGMNGFIETEVVFEIDQLDVFTKIWHEWYYLKDSIRDVYYKMAQGT